MRSKYGVKRISRKELTRRIIVKANLPKNKKTDEYFTKEQLVHLLLLLDNMEGKLQ